MGARLTPWPARRRERRWAAPLSCLLLLTSPAAAAAQLASLVADLNPVLDDAAASSAPAQLTSLGAKVVFAASEPASGRELWVSDGTPNGTQLLIDGCAGTCSADPRSLGVVGGIAYWVGWSDLAQRRGEIWRTDGTLEGTWALSADVPELHAYRQTHVPPTAAVLGDLLYFSGCTASTGCELWRTDGSLGGTSLVAEAHPGSEHGPVHLVTATADRIFFFLGRGSEELWTSDGFSLLRLQPPANDFWHQVGHWTVSSDRLFFLGESAGQGRELWASDGTPGGTRQLTSLPDPEPFGGSLKVIGPNVYFVADDVLHGDELWRSDGTPAGTVRLTDFGYAEAFPFGYSASGIEVAGSRILFVATDGLSPLALWALDGKGVVKLVPVALAPGFETDHWLARAGNRVIFAGPGSEPWASDGTLGGTRALADHCPGDCGQARGFRALGDFVYYLATEPGEGSGLFRTDGQPSGTRLVSDVSPFSTFELAAAGGMVFFPAEDTDRGEELWMTDGTAAGSELVRDIARAPGGSHPDGLMGISGVLVFRACDGITRELWRLTGAGAPVQITHGSGPNYCQESEETQLPTRAGDLVFFLRQDRDRTALQLWRADPFTGEERQLTRFQHGSRILPWLGEVGNAVVFFLQHDADLRIEVWASDGSEAGTARLTELPAEVWRAQEFTAVGGEVYFLADHGHPDGEEVWRADATAAGTRRVSEFDAPGFFPQPPQFTRAGEWVFFVAGSGPELWRTQGSPGSTSLAADLYPGATGSHPADLTAWNGALYFFAGIPGRGRALWRTEGSGAAILAEFAGEDFHSTSPTGLAVAGTRLVFAADDGVHGREPWTSDGTAEGTALLRDIRPGPSSSDPHGFVVNGGRFFFSSDDGSHGPELWASDGVAAGTRMVQDLHPGPAGSHPAELTVSGGYLYFRADDGLTGEELWVLPLSGPPCSATPIALCLNQGRFRVEAAWRDFEGRAGVGRAVPLTPDTGHFWFFDDANVEVVVKALDGRGVNGHFWMFYGALSNVEYALTVTDALTGKAKRYLNPLGRFASAGDTVAFRPQASTDAQEAVVESPIGEPPEVSVANLPAASACHPGPSRLCLNGGRFAVQASWEDFQGKKGTGVAVPLSGDTGYFWFFDDANVEVVVKVLDGRGVNGSFWVFYGALSNVEYALTVTDSTTGKTRTYRNPSGRFASFGDTAAFE